MCKFFSCDSDGDGNLLYFDWELRKKILSGEIKQYEPDSHTSIAHWFGFEGEEEDVLNKYEYNPLTKKFVIDQLNDTMDDSIIVKEKLDNFDWKTIVEPLIIKPIIHPFEMDAPEITPEIVDLVKKWASVRDSIRYSVWHSVGASVKASTRDSVGHSVKASIRNSVGDSVWASAWDSVWHSVWNSVGESVWYSVGVPARKSIRHSVWNSVGDSTGNSIGAYFSSFFDIDYKHDLSPAIKLWEMGLVPSYDGEVWRLHGKPNGKVLWEGTI